MTPRERIKKIEILSSFLSKAKLNDRLIKGYIIDLREHLNKIETDMISMGGDGKWKTLILGEWVPPENNLFHNGR